MSVIGQYSDKEFKEDFPLDFGNGSRGSFIAYGTVGTTPEIIGLLEAHHLPNGDLCCGSAYWKQHPGDKRERPLWELVSLDPLTLTQSIQCDCGHHGHITSGRWIPCGDST